MGAKKQKHRPGYHPRGKLIDGVAASKHPLYHTHANMIDRCYCPTSTSYKNYGARGIQVCERWLSFETFVLDMGPRPTPYHTLERRDNDGHYEPGNCVWASRSTQCVNRRLFVSNKTGSPGVVRKGSRFVARFDYEGKRYQIGIFDDDASAALARSAFVEGFFAARGGLHG